MNTRTAQTGNTDPIGAQAQDAPASASDSAEGTISAWAMLGLLAGPFLSMVDSSIVNVALPDIAQQVQSPLATAQWITSGYLLALAVVLPATAFLAKRFGTRPPPRRATPRGPASSRERPALPRRSPARIPPPA